MASIEEQHAFLDVAKMFEWKELFRQLGVTPSLLNVQPDRRWSALHQAAFAGDKDIVCQLLERRADPWATATAANVSPLDVLGYNDPQRTTSIVEIKNLLEDAVKNNLSGLHSSHQPTQQSMVTVQNLNVSATNASSSSSWHALG